MPCKAGAIAHYRQGGGGVVTFVTGEHGCLAAAQGTHETTRTGRSNIGVATFDERLGSDVPANTITEGGDDADLLA